MSRLSQYLVHLLQQAYPEQEKLSLDVPRHQQAWRCFRGRCPCLDFTSTPGPPRSPRLEKQGLEVIESHLCQVLPRSPYPGPLPSTAPAGTRTL